MAFTIDRPSGRLTTVDNATVTFWEIALPANSLVQIHLVVMATDNAGGYALWSADISLYRAGNGDALVVGANTKNKVVIGEGSKWNFDLNANGPNARLQVTGEVGDVVDWGAEGQLYQMAVFPI